MVREGMTNAGKKEQRQINQLLNKAAKEGQTGEGRREVLGRTVPKQHGLKQRKGK